jgi:hypothetical protein
VRGAAALILASACAHPVTAPPRPAACPADTFAIEGACLATDSARAYCGNAARPEGGGCAPIPCSDGEPVDLESGECVPLMALRRLGAGARRGAEDAGLLGCEDGGLVVEGESFACLPHERTCGRGERWSGEACRPDPPCPPGAVTDASGGCVAVVRSDRGEAMLDVGTWIRLVVGPDGGSGTAAVCGPLDQRPWLAGVPPHGEAVLEIQADMVFPDNIVSEARVTVTARRQVDVHNFGPSAVVPLGDILDPVWTTLRAMKGVASAASSRVRVHCTIEGGSGATRSRPPVRDGGPAGPEEDPAS